MPANGASRRVKVRRTDAQRAEETAIHRRFQTKESIQGLLDRGEIDSEAAERMRQRLAEGPPVETLRRLMEQLRAERENQRLSLADMAQRTGMDRAALHRLETGRNLNPTIATLEGYARALGKRLAWAVENDDPVPTGS